MWICDTGQNGTYLGLVPLFDIFYFRDGMNYTAKVIKEDKDDSWKFEILQRVLEVSVSYVFHSIFLNCETCLNLVFFS
jgi:hypothetical protein